MCIFFYASKYSGGVLARITLSGVHIILSTPSQSMCKNHQRAKSVFFSFFYMVHFIIKYLQCRIMFTVIKHVQFPQLRRSTVMYPMVTTNSPTVAKRLQVG